MRAFACPHFCRTVSGVQMTVTFVTGNENKLKEVQQILSDTQITLLSSDICLQEIQGSVEDVAKHKCKEAFSMLNIPVITEDTCLAFDCLNGLPGPYVKWFLASVGPQGKCPFSIKLDVFGLTCEHALHLRLLLFSVQKIGMVYAFCNDRAISHGVFV